MQMRYRSRDTLQTMLQLLQIGFSLLLQWNLCAYICDVYCFCISVNILIIDVVNQHDFLILIVLIVTEMITNATRIFLFCD